MKQILKIGIILSILFMVNKNTNLNASCVSQNGVLDNGHCDKSDINNKKCGSGSPLDCYIPLGRSDR